MFGVLVALFRQQSVRTLKIPFGPFISAGALIQMILVQGRLSVFA
jgi:prepilin signal peptidase PulO-like enzyme (type II secretory pathway)